MRRWLVTAAALVLGAGLTAFQLWYDSPARGSKAVYVLARDVPAGAIVGSDGVRTAALRGVSGVEPPLGPAGGRLLQSARATHDLRAGQLLQLADLAPTATPTSDRRLVVVPVRQAPPVAAGDRVDLLLVAGAGDHLSVTPFALGLEVKSVEPAGLVLAVTSRAAAGLVYAAATGQLVAVAADRTARPGLEAPLTSLEEASAAVRP